MLPSIEISLGVISDGLETILPNIPWENFGFEIAVSAENFEFPDLENMSVDTEVEAYIAVRNMD